MNGLSGKIDRQLHRYSGTAGAPTPTVPRTPANPRLTEARCDDGTTVLPCGQWLRAISPRRRSMAVNRRLRFEILRRDGYACRYCGAKAPGAHIEVDHVQPSALGGSDTPDNLVAACSACNGGKAATPLDAPLVAQVNEDALRWQRAMVRAREMEEAEEVDAADLATAFVEHWCRYRLPNGDTVAVDESWEDSIRQFTKAGLSLDDLTRAVDAAMAKPRVSANLRWRYFCGVAWRTLSDRQARARRLIESGAV